MYMRVNPFHTCFQCAMITRSKLRGVIESSGCPTAAVPNLPRPSPGSFPSCTREGFVLPIAAGDFAADGGTGGAVALSGDDAV